MNTFQVYQRIDNGQLTPQYRQPQNALGINIEIINDSEKIPSYTVIPCEVESYTRHQHVVLGYISNVHYVATEFQEPFAPVS